MVNWHTPLLTLLLTLLLAACSSPVVETAVPESQSHVLADFEGQLPLNRAGEPYVSQYEGEGGKARIEVVPGSGVDGTCALRLEMLEGTLLLQFNAHNADGTRGFAREYVKSPAAWKFNTYNRMSFWMKNPPGGAFGVPATGDGGFEFGTYVKRVHNADKYSDEEGGEHYYHRIHVPNTGTWTRVILNAHPHHARGGIGNDEQGNQLHPTGETGYNYFDALTRFYVNEAHAVPAGLQYEFDRFEFYREPEAENDDQVYSIALTYVPSENRHILTWSRRKDEDSVKHEVRYATRSVHAIGWAAATPAPDGVVTPRGEGGYNGMHYSTTAIKAGQAVWFAIKPQNSPRFSQISLQR